MNQIVFDFKLILLDTYMYVQGWLVRVACRWLFDIPPSRWMSHTSNLSIRWTVRDFMKKMLNMNIKIYNEWLSLKGNQFVHAHFK